LDNLYQDWNLVTASSQPTTHSPIELLYLWGARCVGGVLLIGVVFHIARLLVGSADGVLGDLGRIWPEVVLISLAMVPVVSLAVAGTVWILRNRRDTAGWMAIATAVFLSSLWVLK
jgi:hypothetical protein